MFFKRGIGRAEGTGNMQGENHVKSTRQVQTKRFLVSLTEVGKFYARV